MDIKNIKSLFIYLILFCLYMTYTQDNAYPELTYFSFSPDTVNLNRNPVEFIILQTALLTLLNCEA